VTRAAEYLERIGYRDFDRPRLATLIEIHRAHLATIPYEALVIPFGQQRALTNVSFHDHLVTQGQGGWCYEMNGLLIDMLIDMGFRVTRAGAAISRDRLGDRVIGNHMVGLIDLDEGRYVTDVGLGDGPVDPFPLREGVWIDNGLEYRVEKLEDGWWRFHNHQYALTSNFDFTEDQKELEWFQEPCARLQTGDRSPFLKHLVAIRRAGQKIRALVDTTYTEMSPAGSVSREIVDQADYVQLMTTILGRSLGPELDLIWSTAQQLATLATEPW
jgi:N-hydroxyarylamine O-acetyltransferase